MPALTHVEKKTNLLWLVEFLVPMLTCGGVLVRQVRAGHLFGPIPHP